MNGPNAWELLYAVAPDEPPSTSSVTAYDLLLKAYGSVEAIPPAVEISNEELLAKAGRAL